MISTDGVFAHVSKYLLVSISEGELDNDPNLRDKRTKKNVRSPRSGEFELESTRDRNGIVEPSTVDKR
jgi:putative transposase